MKKKGNICKEEIGAKKSEGGVRSKRKLNHKGSNFALRNTWEAHYVCCNKF